MEQANGGTPKARPRLNFANSVYAPSPSGNRRFGTPRSTRGSRVLDRDALPSSTLNQSSMDAARNIFRASSLSASTGPRFEPSIPGNTLRKVFAPAATPEPKRLFRDSTTKATPRRTLAGSTSTDLFKMAIPEPPSDLTGADLAKRVPEDMDQQLGSVFADQYLEHLCPKDFNQVQRRQFFCILDLRRLKHAADEIFAKKDWKLNIMNFAKEFEKSRSLILLRYGLYEFRNVKPSADVLRKWRAAHGLEDEEPQARDSPTVQPSKASTKRKADDELDASEDRSARQTAGKRRAVGDDTPATETAAPAFQTKRKASLTGDDQPAKQQKTTSSATKTFLERIASNPSTPAAQAPAPTTSKSLFGAKPDLARSVLDKNKNASGGNIFSYLSDASKNSGVDADGESESDSEPEVGAPQANGVVNGTATAIGQFASKTSSASGPGSAGSSEARESTPSRSLFDRVTKGTDGQPVRFGQAGDSPADTTADATSVPSQPATTHAPANKTWTPDTPLKFAPQASQESSALGNGSSSAASIFSANTQSTSSLFGAQKPSQAAVEKPKQPGSDGDKSGGESDKENASQPASKLFPPASIFKPSNGTPQPAASPLFKPAASGSESGASNADVAKGAAESDAQKPADATSTPSLFGNKTQPSSSLFGSSTPAAPTSTLFGNKPVSAAATTGDAAATPASNVPKPTSLFGAPSTTPAQPPAEAPKPTSSLFGNAGAASTEAPKAGGLFGNAGAASTEAPKAGSLFGNAGAASTEAPKTGGLFGNAGAASTEAPKTGGLFGATTPAATSNLFGGAPGGSALFGSSQKPASTSISTGFTFGAGSATETVPKGSETPKAEPKAAGASALFGSPMKQDSPQKRGIDDAMQEDQPNPAKKLFGGTAPPVFFGGPQTSTSNTTTSFSFGSTPSTSAAPMFGGTTPSAGAVNFNFSGGQQTPAPNFSSSFGGTSSTPATTGGMFNFGSTTGPVQQPGSQSFTFGDSSASAAPSSGLAAGGTQDAANPFSFNQGSGPNTSRATTPSGRVIKKPNFGASRAKAARGGFSGSPAPQQPGMFGGNQGATPAQGSTPSFSFSAPSPQPQGQQLNPFGANPGQPAGAMFGGASTTGTNSPLNNNGGASSLATTPATGTPEPGTDAEATGKSTAKPDVAKPDAAASGDASGGNAEEGDAEPAHAQINLVDGGPGEEDETVVHEVRAKVMKFMAPGDGSDGEQKKAKSPWSTKGVGPLRVLKHKATGAVRVLLRKEPAGQVALNRTLLPNINYKAEEKYVKLMTSDESGSGLETWMIQVKTKDLAKDLAEALEKYKGSNKK
ncbi:related to nuclear pore protein NSP1 [Cephalotrichum gorgonifer]|uniref:Related to nuclear pore protein NSP1 n=1 Tax=Cephalotrichum gorgonifer TaxID=2041049 RepID=A0AAE8SRN7_9PEZI|nr:related to nuclear pore protein NSP1 [Cephalotrichum gorgonifer]